MTVTLINPFVVPAAISDEEFLRRWRDSSDHLTRERGFLETRLHRNTGAADTEFRFVNVASWESAEAYREAFGGDVSPRADDSGVEYHPGLFEPFFEKKGTG